jgi:hypothetical protein
MSAPSPAPRSASTGPNGPLTTPTTGALVNGIAAGSGNVAATQSAPAPGGSVPSMSQQNLNQIVSASFRTLRVFELLRGYARRKNIRTQQISLRPGPSSFRKIQ